MGILGFGVLTMAAALLTSMKYSRHSRSMMQAMYLAEEQIEAFSAMSTEDVVAMTDVAGYPNDSRNPIDPDPSDGDQTTFNRRWLIEEDTPETGIVTITLEVDWVDQDGKTRTISLPTLKTES